MSILITLTATFHIPSLGYKNKLAIYKSNMPQFIDALGPDGTLMSVPSSSLWIRVHSVQYTMNSILVEVKYFLYLPLSLFAPKHSVCQLWTRITRSISCFMEEDAIKSHLGWFFIVGNPWRSAPVKLDGSTIRSEQISTRCRTRNLFATHNPLNAR